MQRFFLLTALLAEVSTNPTTISYTQLLFLERKKRGLYLGDIFYMQWFLQEMLLRFCQIVRKQEQQMATGIFPDFKINSFYCETETVLDAVNWHVSISLPLESSICIGPYTLTASPRL